MEACGALAAAPQITRVQLAQRRRVVSPADAHTGMVYAVDKDMWKGSYSTG